VLGDLPEFMAWALVYQAESGDHAKVPLARRAATGIANPVLQARIQALPAGKPDRQMRGIRNAGNGSQTPRIRRGSLGIVTRRKAQEAAPQRARRSSGLCGSPGSGSWGADGADLAPVLCRLPGRQRDD
jgi:hypothetical protein